jgi:hypothetical protein
MADYFAKPDIPNPEFEDKLIKVCLDPMCEAVYHNCEPSDRRCLCCGHKLLRIDAKTWEKKYSKWFWQYDFQTQEFYRPKTNSKETINIFEEVDYD